MTNSYDSDGIRIVDEHARKLRFIDLLLTRSLYILTAAFLVINSVIYLARQDRSHETLTRLVDCTTPGHSCYDKGQVSQQKAILELEQIVIAANFCTRDTKNDTVQKVTMCVSGLINK
jgi:hypothetical protein